MCATGNNWRTLKRYALEVWRIPVDHFDPHEASRERLRQNQWTARPLDEVLVEGSAFSRVQLKKRLYAEGLKRPLCEMCGQDELWRGRRMSLILDHVNGVSDDHRLGNLRILCPNCAATLDTHCGRNVGHPRRCAVCDSPFRPSSSKQLHCSHRCGAQSDASREAYVVAPSRRAAAIRAADSRDRGDELARGGAEVRRVGQRNPEVGAGVRGRAWIGCAGRAGARWRHQVQSGRPGPKWTPPSQRSSSGRWWSPAEDGGGGGCELVACRNFGQTTGNACASPSAALR